MKQHLSETAACAKGGRRILGILPALVLALALALACGNATAQRAFAEEEEAVLAEEITSIATAADLQTFAASVTGGNDYAGKTVTLTADIDLSGVTGFAGIGTADKRFAGTFDGAGHTIKNVSITSTNAITGLFASTTNTAVIRDFTLEGAVECTAAMPGYGETLYGVGAVVGVNRGTISGVTSKASVTTTASLNTGGIAGFNAGEVNAAGTGQYANAIVEAENGGKGTISACIVTGDVKGYHVTGGIAGENAGTIDSCLVFGKVDGEDTSGKNGVGGIAGRNGCNNTAHETGVIGNCAMFGTVGRSGQKWTGGIAGFCSGQYQNASCVPSSVTNCYMAGTLATNKTGYDNQIVGNLEGTSTNNYAISTDGNTGSSPGEIGIETTLDDLKTQTMASNLSVGSRWTFAVSGTDAVYALLKDKGFEGVTVPSAFTAAEPTVTKQEWSGEDTVKKDYIAGQSFDMGSLALVISYSDGSCVKTPLAADYTGPFTTEDNGRTITVSGGGYSKTFSITVTADVVNEIKITTAPSNVTYAKDEDFDPTGMVVKAYYSSAPSTAVALDSTDYTCAKDWENSKVTVSYTFNGKTVTAEQAVTVLSINTPAKVGDSYQIGSAEELFWFANKVNTGSTAIDGTLTADITVGALEGYKGIGGSATKPYKGTFDGANHTVTMAGTSTTGGGNCMFYYVGEGAVIQNINFTGTINSAANYNAPIGILTAATVQNITSDMAITGGNYVAGLIGQMASGTVSNCVTTGGSVTGNGTYAGGCVSQIKGGTITNCGNNATVENTGTGSAGGFIGTVYSPASDIAITNCYNTGDVTSAGSASTSNGRGGGFIGTAKSGSNASMTVTDCYNTGNVTAYNCVGGFCGYAYGYSTAKPLTFTNCYNAGTVTNKSGSVTGYTGSFLGLAATGNTAKYVTCANCYGSSDACASIYGSSSTATTFTPPTGKTAAELKAASMLTTLGSAYKADGTGACSINGGYPVLSWQDTSDPAYRWYGDGSATAYTIETAAELAAFANIVNGTVPAEYSIAQDGFAGKTVTLTADIDLSGISNWTPIGNASQSFAGTFDGAGKAITGLTITSCDEGYAGLFGNNAGTVKNFSVAGQLGADGTPIGESMNVPESQSGEVSGGKDNFAAAVGFNTGIITRVDSSVAVYAQGYAIGGICGRNQGGTVSRCSNTGVVNASVAGYRVGGICGHLSTGLVTECYSTANVIGNNFKNGCQGVGGIVGSVADGTDQTGKDGGTVSYCYCTADTVTDGPTWTSIAGGKQGTGGLIGALSGGNCYNCYSLVKDTYAPASSGLLIGKLGTGNYNNLYFESVCGEKTATAHSSYGNYTFANENADGSIVVGQAAFAKTYNEPTSTTGNYWKTTEAMKSADFVTALNAGASAFTADDATDPVNNGYPVLSWQGTPAGTDEISIDPIADLTYTGEVLEPVITVKVYGNVLDASLYSAAIEPEQVKDAGEYTVTVTGTGIYKGMTATRTFRVKSADASGAKVTCEPASYAETGSAIVPTSVKVELAGFAQPLVAGTDYDLSYSGNVAPGTATVTATFKGNFTGVAKGGFEIGDNRYAVTFAAGNQAVTGDVPVMAAQLPGAAIELPSADKLALTGYSFAGWLCSADGKTYAAGDAYTMPAADVAFTAQWALNYVPGENPVEGENRYETAAAIATTAFPEGSAGVVVATGENFPDALAASSLAGMLDWPVVLTKKADLESATLKTIDDLGAKQAVIVGGTNAVSADVEAALSAKLGDGAVERISGTDRYDTAVKVYEYGRELDGAQWSGTAILATGTNYPDALSISGYAFKAKAPIFLCDSADGISQAVLDALKDGGFGKVVVVGGTSVVSDADLAAAQAACGNNAERLAGDERYATSKAIAEFCIQNGCSANGACIATGANFPDALAGGALAGRTGTVMLLAAEGSTASFDVLSAAQEGSVDHLYFLGGEEAIPQTVRDAALDAAGLK